MWPVSQRFRDSLAGSHEAVTRARIMRTSRGEVPQFTATPTGGQEIPVITGDVAMTLLGDIKRTASVTTEGAFWADAQPYGNELFIERGIDFGDGTTEYVPLGYFLITDVDQPEAPYGPIEIKGSDRTFITIDTVAYYPQEVPAGRTHRQLFSDIINDGLYNFYQMYGTGYDSGNVVVPITWSAYNPDAFIVPNGTVTGDNAFKFLSDFLDPKEAVLRFSAIGALDIAPRYADQAAGPVLTVKHGEGGTRLRMARSTSRRGIPSYVFVTGNDPAARCFGTAALDTPGNPLHFGGPFGVRIQHVASPNYKTTAAATAAAEKIVNRYTGLPVEVDMDIVPNPALEPGDRVTIADLGESPQIASLSVPLGASSAPTTIKTRTLNEVT